MGLYVSFTPEDLGYPVSLIQEILGEEVVVDVDYTAACEAFVSTFMTQATSLVPVDTGYLQSTIDARTNGFMCEAEATAEYAQYVEYGTWKMRAQPYFTPAVEEGIAAFQAVAGEALDEAQEELKEICESIMEAAQATFSDGSFLGDIGATLLGGLMLWLMFPILVNLYGIMKSLDPNSEFGSGGNGGIGGTSVSVIIT